MITGCGADEFGDDPSIYGTWSDDVVSYTFRQDKTYSKKFLRLGAGFAIADTSEVSPIDSTFGTFEINTSDNNIIFTQTGYRNYRLDTIIEETIVVEAWNYSIAGDMLSYSNQTSVGQLTRE